LDGRVLIYTGPNRADTGRIVVSGSVASGNDKTGPVFTVWVLPRAAALDGKVWSSIRDSGDDRLTCGSCPRKTVAAGGDGSCYTHAAGSQILSGGAASVARAAQRESPGLPDMLAPLMRIIGAMDGAKSVRLCAYGDSDALPRSVLALIRAGRDMLRLKSLAYTHEWRDSPALLEDHMGSADTLDESQEIRAMGGRSFRVVKSKDEISEGEIWCPAAHRKDGSLIRSGDGATCDKCGLCGGKGSKGPSIVILDQGPKKSPAYRAEKRALKKERKAAALAFANAVADAERAALAL